MNQWKVWLSGLALFCAGIVVGVMLPFVLGRFFGPGMPPGSSFGGPGGEPPTPDKFIMEHMTRTLDLTERQQKDIQPLIKEMVKDIHAVNKKIFPEADRVADTYGEKIKKLLKPDQIDRFDVMVKEIRSRRERMLPSGPPPPGMPPPPGFSPPPPAPQ